MRGQPRRSAAFPTDPRKTETTEPAAGPIESIVAGMVYARLGSRRSGLTASEASQRLGHYGPNEITHAKRIPLFQRVGAHFTHLMAILLWVGGVVAFAAGLPELGVAVWLVNLVNGAFSFWQEFRAEKATEALRRLLPPQARVLRDQDEIQVAATDLVPGDVILIAEGDRISADARLVEHALLRVDQSALSGEAEPVRKDSGPISTSPANRAELGNLVFAGTTVVSGSGRAVVYSTGMGTELGAISHLTQTTGSEQSPLQKELAKLSVAVTVIAVGVGTVFFVVALAFGAMNVARGFVFCLGMIVAFVPEGLLPTVTLALAMGTQRMANRNALVKRLSAVETLGSTTVICTDKTGTLTQNEMTVRELVVPSGRATVTGVGYTQDGDLIAVDGASDAVADEIHELLLAAGLDSNARILDSEEGKVIRGDPTEGAILVACAKAGIDLTDETLQRPRVLELPFDPNRKRMSTVHAGAAGSVVFTKGAPRELLALCASARRNGSLVPLDGELRSRIEADNDRLGRNGLRVLAVATRDLGDRPANAALEIETDLVYLGLIAMQDPPRPEVEDAVSTCRRAGIRIIMITGDYGLTAESIGRRIGIIGTDHVRIVNGDELERMSDDELDRALTGEVVFARSSPQHKMRIVTALQRSGEIVAVTGDGVNDAPALKKADIGVAMGRSGTDVARESADMILLDDNFASIVNAVEEGRAVYDNIRRFTSYIFTSNTPEVVPFVAFALSAGRIPLALDVMAILAIDLGTDLVPALALGAEPPEPGVMDRPPRRQSDHIVDRPLLTRAYFWLGPVQAATVMLAFFATYWMAGYSGFFDLPDSGPVYGAAVAMALAAVVGTQIGNLFAQRAEPSRLHRRGFIANRLIWIGIATELAIVAAIAYLPFLQRIVGTAPFPVEQWLWLIPMVPILFAADRLRSALHRRKESK